MWETTTKRSAEPLATCERATKAMRTMTDSQSMVAEVTGTTTTGTAAASSASTCTPETSTMAVTMHLETNHYLRHHCRHSAEQESQQERQRRRQIWWALQHRWNHWFVAPTLLGLDERRHAFQRCLAQMDRIIMDQDSVGQSVAANNEWWLFHHQFATLPRYQQIAFRELVSHAFFRNNGLLTDTAVHRWVSME